MDSDTLHTEVISSLAGLQMVRDEWDVLHGEGGANPFSASTWAESWVQTCLEKRSLRIILVRDGDQLVGVAPLYRRIWHGLRVLQPVGKENLFGGEVVNVLVGEGHTEEVAVEVARTMAVDDWDALLWHGVRTGEDGMERHVLHAIEVLKQGRMITTMAGVVPCIDFTAGWDGYMASRSAKHRRNIRQIHSRCERAGIEVLTKKDTFGDEEVTLLLSVEGRSWQGQRGRAIIGDNEDFFRRVLPRLHETGQVGITWAMSEGLPVAFALMLYGRNLAYGYMTAYDAAYSEYGVGNLVNYHAFKSCFERGILKVDLMMDMGREVGWKSHWSTSYGAGLRCVVFRNNIKGRLAAAASCLLR